jgi:hypothetical protein
MHAPRSTGGGSEGRWWRLETQYRPRRAKSGYASGDSPWSTLRNKGVRSRISTLQTAFMGLSEAKPRRYDVCAPSERWERSPCPCASTTQPNAREDAQAGGHEVGSMKSGYVSGNFLIETAENTLSATATTQICRSRAASLGRITRRFKARLGTVLGS